jgi:ParB family chromosome partitioning protein
MHRNPVLGKGLNALIPEYPEAQHNAESTRQMIDIKVDEIEPNPYQARTVFDEGQLEELANSLKEKGLIQPISVNRQGQGYQLIAGERRWRAAQKAGFEIIPAIVFEIDSTEELMEIGLVENIQRENLSPIEEAEGYRALMDKCFLTQQDVAERIGKPRSTIANLLNLLKLPTTIQEFLRQGRLERGHAKVLLALDDEEAQLELGERCVEEQWTVRDIEKAIKSHKAGRPDKNDDGLIPSRDPMLIEFEEKLQHKFGTGVGISYHAKKGRIEIDFYDDSDLERILELLLDGEE